MMWVIRAGQRAQFYEKYIETSRVYIPWDGYKIDLSEAESRADFRKIVEREKGTSNRTSVSNWAGQLYSFTREINNNDYVLIPSEYSRRYCLAQINGDYVFDRKDKDHLYHSRKIIVLETGLPRDVFSQSIQYSLGAFRTIFKTKHEDEILETIQKWKEASDENSV